MISAGEPLLNSGLHLFSSVGHSFILSENCFLKTIILYSLHSNLLLKCFQGSMPDSVNMLSESIQSVHKEVTGADPASPVALGRLKDFSVEFFEDFSLLFSSDILAFHHLYK